MNYYNEHDPKTAAWLRELIRAGHIPAGHVDERSIADVQPADLAGFVQCHFFAGIGGWPYALQLAGWPSDRPVWTGSCPCQPFSDASLHNTGAKGQGDRRHLWPQFFSLIRERRPPVVFGEQVAGAVQWGWLDEVCLDLEGEGYSCASSVLPASAFGADHERKRLFWVANSSRAGWEGYKQDERFSVPAFTPLAISRDNFTLARSVMEGSHVCLLPGDGLPLQVERDAVKAFGNAIVPQVAAEFIRAAEEAMIEAAPSEKGK